MTEQEWLNCTSAYEMLCECSVGSGRKWLLLACGHCRRMWDQMKHESWRYILGCLERWADEPDWVGASGSTLEEMLAPTTQGLLPLSRNFSEWTLTGVTAEVLQTTLIQTPHVAVEMTQRVLQIYATQQGIEAVERQLQSAMFRDIFGNPFRPITVDPRWLTETTVALATGIYQERAFDRMSILADALEDAECDHADILNHCRGEGPHVRGCWVVDLLLSKQ